MADHETRSRANETPWWEFRILCPPTVSDAVAGVVFELGASGIEEGETSRDGRSFALLRGYYQVPDPDPVHEALAGRLDALGAYLPEVRGTRVSVSRVDLRDWNRGWKAHFGPTPITKRIVVCPPWAEYDPRDEETVVTIDPGLAFGTGQHETTRGCLRVIDALYGGDPVPGVPPTFPKTVLDVGTGSAILLVAALKLGATAGTGVDRDPEALSTAAENCRRNGVETRAVLVDSNRPDTGGTFDLVLANILAATLEAMASDLAHRVVPGGLLCLSGILASQVEHLLPIFQGVGMRPLATLSENAWVTIVLQRGDG